MASYQRQASARNHQGAEGLASTSTRWGYPLEIETADPSGGPGAGCRSLAPAHLSTRGDFEKPLSIPIAISDGLWWIANIAGYRSWG